MNKQVSLAILAACIGLSASGQASAYYAPHLGRFLTRDPAGQRHVATISAAPRAAERANEQTGRDRLFGADAMELSGYVSGWNLYEYVQDKPTVALDPSGLYPFPNPQPGGWVYPPQEPAPKPAPIGSPLPSNSPECDKYDCKDTYRGANARCFCKCAGDSPWSNHVRGCLRELYEQGVPPNEAHNRCYANADGQDYPGGRPGFLLAHCFLKCSGFYDSLSSGMNLLDSIN